MPQAVPRKSPARSRTRLRELGVYRLPDDREFVVSTVYTDGCSLYTPQAWAAHLGAEFWVDGSGRLSRRGEPVRWRIEDLEDTGRTTTYPRPLVH
jgi:hypothetical protein